MSTLFVADRLARIAKLSKLVVVAFLIGLTVVPSDAFAQRTGRPATPAAVTVSATGLSPEALSAKALLEDLLAKRFAHGLATQIARDAFTVGANLDLVEVAKKVEPTPTPKPEEPLTDLALGQFDPEQLIQNFSKPEDQKIAARFLEHYQIRFVEVSVGLSESLPDETKAQVRRWVDARVQVEFGQAGKALVNSIKPLPTPTPIPTPAPTPKPERTLVDWLSEFQSLAGQLVTALAIMIGVLLWQFTSRKEQTAGRSGDDITLNTQVSGMEGEGRGQGGADSIKKEMVSSSEKLLAERTQKLREIVPHVGPRMGSIVQSWCQLGENGFLKVAVLAEAVGKDIGKLPIPVDDAEGVKAAFGQMASLSGEKRLTILDEVYWDFLAAINLGPDVLQKPFSYLTSTSTSMLKDVLIQQNPRMKTLVSLYMPDRLRSQYLESLDTEEKLGLLREAARLREMPRREISEANASIKSLIQPKGGADVVSLGPTLSKIAAALRPVEELRLLAQLGGPEIETFKREVPTLAFLGEWVEEPMKLLFEQATPDEVAALCVAREDLADRVLSICPQMTVEIVRDEIGRSKGELSKESEDALLRLKRRLEGLVGDGSIRLDTLYGSGNSGQNSGEGDGQIRAA